MAYQDYMPTIQADYIDEIFTLRSNKSIEIIFDKPNSTFVPDGGIPETTDLTDYFDTLIQTNYNTLNQVNKDFILDLYIDDYKADGLRKSFLFKHPVNNEYYICKFINNISETMERNFKHSYGQIKFLSIGADRNLISTSTWVSGEITATGFSPISGAGAVGYDSILNYGETLNYNDVW